MHAAYTHTPEIVIFFFTFARFKVKTSGKGDEREKLYSSFFSPELTAEKDYEELWCGYLFIGLSINGHLDFLYLGFCK